jgi:hypothetical protein
MATASPIDPPIVPVLESAIQKLRVHRAEEPMSDVDPLTVEERAAVRERGRAILEAEGSDEPEPGAQRGVDDAELDMSLEEDAVLGEADEREGRHAISGAELLQRLRAIA